MKNVVITGVSTGIGLAAAKKLLSGGYRVFGSVRKAADAGRLGTELGPQFVPLLFDVTDHTAVYGAAEEVKSQIEGQGLTALINNAGISVSGPVQDLSVDDYRRQFDVNFFGMIAVTQAFLPLLGARQDPGHPPGKIINISSISGKLAMPFLSPYASSKFAMEAFSQSLRVELLKWGIDVIVIAPGPVKTPIWDKVPDAADFGDSEYLDSMQVMKDFIFKQKNSAIPAEKIAELIHKVMGASRPKARYTILRNYLKDYWIPLKMPRRSLDKLMGKMLKIKK